MKKKVIVEEAISMAKGEMLVEAMVSIHNMKCNPVRSFTLEELEKITNSYNSLAVTYASDCRLYKGNLGDRPVFVKTFDGDFGVHQFNLDSIVIALRMSVHRNVLKLIGCCLEAETPLLVHEFAANGSLENAFRSSSSTHWKPLSWKCRMKIAMDIANVIAYLHIAFPRPMIHRNIGPAVILLDEYNVAKLSDFSLCITIPEGESHVQEAMRICFHDREGGCFCDREEGCFAPEYSLTGFVTEKVDVFNFGVLMFVLLTGQRWFQGDERIDIISFIKSNSGDTNFDDNRLDEVVDPSILKEECWARSEKQFQDFTALAFRCTKRNGDDRPTMTEVAKQLIEIEMSALHEERLVIKSFIKSNSGDTNFDTNRLHEVLDPSILKEDCWPSSEKQFRDFTELAFRCITTNGDDRPTITEVAKQLTEIDRSALCQE